MYKVYYKHILNDSHEIMDIVSTIEKAWQIVGQEICKAHDYAPDECPSIIDFVVLSNNNKINKEKNVFFTIPNDISYNNPHLIAFTENDTYYLIKN